VNARDDGGGAGVDRLAHAVEPERILDVLVVREADGRALPLDVRSRAEALPLAGENDDPRVADVAERLRQLGDQPSVERITALGTGERDPKDGTVSLDAQRAHGRELRVGR
jgi:hypothetical protein